MKKLVQLTLQGSNYSAYSNNNISEIEATAKKMAKDFFTTNDTALTAIVSAFLRTADKTIWLFLQYDRKMRAAIIRQEEVTNDNLPF